MIKKICVTFLCIILSLSATVTCFAAESRELVTQQVQPRETLYQFFTKEHENQSFDTSKKVEVSGWVSSESGGSITSQYTQTIAYSFNISLTSNEKSLVKASAGYSISESVTTMVGVNLALAPGTKRKMMFIPTIVHVDGKMYTASMATGQIIPGSTKSVTSQFPAKLPNGQADGEYCLMDEAGKLYRY